ncbi:MAG: ORF6N domain-containing protein [Acidobacteria bacterium]|nr:ORF6N domain-containing protein [Acidobacteriota bacterium]
MLDQDLAVLYGVETRALVQAVRRNRDRSPSDFMFQLTPQEFRDLRTCDVKLGRAPLSPACLDGAECFYALTETEVRSAGGETRRTVQSRLRGHPTAHGAGRFFREKKDPVCPC